jgi:hypothetical protein
MKELPRRVEALRRGTSAAQVWQKLGLTTYRHSLGGVSFPTKERYWLNWNHELELIFEAPTAQDEPGPAHADNQKLLRATLYRNGREVASSP